MSIVLPTTKVKAERVNPKRLIIYSKPKTGKTTAFAGLENNLILDLEQGSEYVEALKVKIDPTLFLEKFGAPIEKIDELVKAKTVTISSLMEIAPVGTVDPTPSLYNTTMYAMAFLLVIAFFSNLLIKPVNKKHYVENTHPGFNDK